MKRRLRYILLRRAGIHGTNSVERLIAAAKCNEDADDRKVVSVRVDEMRLHSEAFAADEMLTRMMKMELDQPIAVAADLQRVPGGEIELSGPGSARLGMSRVAASCIIRPLADVELYVRDPPLFLGAFGASERPLPRARLASIPVGGGRGHERQR